MDISVILSAVSAIAGIGAVVVSSYSIRRSFELNIKAQQELRHKTLEDQARVELIAAIRNYQKWMDNVSVIFYTLPCSATGERNGLPVSWNTPVENLTRQICEPDVQIEWLRRLEEFEILFPETIAIRPFLAANQQLIGSVLANAHSDFCLHFHDSASPVDRLGCADHWSNKCGVVLDQSALVHDLIVHIQNRCLSPLTGAKMRERKPVDKGLPYIVLDECGLLKVIFSSGASETDTIGVTGLVTNDDKQAGIVEGIPTRQYVHPVKQNKIAHATILIR